VILDNFEQLVAQADATVGRWLDVAGDAAFLVTSRERLGLAGEQVLLLDPLDAESDAIALFAERARAQLDDFDLDDAMRRDVAAVVAQLDGLPLAIELAAARVAVLSPAQIAVRLRDRFAMLRLPGGAGPARRQAALEAAIDWSWALLQPWEQSTLAQCAVFDGGFTLEAAEQVIDLGAWSEAPPVMDVVQSLVDKSLVRAWTTRGGHPRRDLDEPFFGMFLSIQDYARGKLAAAGDATRTEAERRHGRCYARHGTLEAIDALMLEGGWRRRRTLAADLDNLVTAGRWRGAMRTSLPMRWPLRGPCWTPRAPTGSPSRWRRLWWVWRGWRRSRRRAPATSSRRR
jgi:predicted ATPase